MMYFCNDMNIAVLGSGPKLTSWMRKANAALTYVQDTKTHTNYEVFIDLDFDEHPERISEYATNKKTIFLLNTCLTTLESAMFQFGLSYDGQKFVGINAFPLMAERELLEVTSPFNFIPSGDVFAFLGYQPEYVQSRVGFITPRIICMIINEAYYTVQEGTASKNDIDTGMKLGTNYPKGPFEFCNEFGIKQVYLLLEALYQDTHDERYKICSLLKSEYLKSI